jgi:poly(3-hydroxybutyrate) depolymerase
MRGVAVCSVLTVLGAAAFLLSCGSKSTRNSSDQMSEGSSGTSNAAGGTTAGADAGGHSNGAGEASGAASGGGGSGGSSGGSGGGGGGGSSGASGGTTAISGAGGTSGGGGASEGPGAVKSLGCISQQVPKSGHFTIDVGGTEREYILALPPSYDVTKPTAYRLYILLHGRMFSAQAVVDGMQPSMTGPYYGLQAASGGNAILVAAQALSTSWTNENGRDVAYINAMIARFKTEICFDESRIFGVGFSMGAIMTLTEACDASSVFRAIAPMSASLPSGCSSTGKPLAYWGSHGTKDPTIDISQGEAVRDSFIKKNGCKSTSTAGDRAGCVNYDGCSASAPVTWCTFEGVHEPPTFAGEAIWGFTSKL